MAIYDIKIKVDAPEPLKAVELGNLIQFVVTNINRDDLVKLLNKVRKDPTIVKTALMFLK